MSMRAYPNNRAVTVYLSREERESSTQSRPQHHLTSLNERMKKIFKFLKLSDRRENLRRDMYTAQFNHGVASGDPLSDSIVLWTRVTPTFESVVLESDSCDENSPSFEIRYFVSKDGGEVTSGTHTALCANDWTVKIDVVGLDSGMKYSYGFESSSYSSPQGRFRLPTDDMESLAFAVFSCANLGYGYFNAYVEIQEISSSSLGNIIFCLHTSKQTGTVTLRV